MLMFSIDRHFFGEGRPKNWSSTVKKSGCIALLRIPKQLKILVSIFKVSQIPSLHLRVNGNEAIQQWVSSCHIHLNRTHGTWEVKTTGFVQLQEEKCKGRCLQPPYEKVWRRQSQPWKSSVKLQEATDTSWNVGNSSHMQTKSFSQWSHFFTKWHRPKACKSSITGDKHTWAGWGPE